MMLCITAFIWWMVTLLGFIEVECISLDTWYILITLVFVAGVVDHSCDKLVSSIKENEVE